MMYTPPSRFRVESPSPAMVAYREKYNHPAAARQMICSDIKIPMAYPKKAFVRAWNQLVSKKTRYQPILQRTADTTDNALTRLRAREMIRNNSNNQQEVSRMVVRGFWRRQNNQWSVKSWSIQALSDMRACGYKAFGVRLCKHILVVVANTILSIQMDENQFIVCNDKGYDIAYYESLAWARTTLGARCTVISQRVQPSPVSK